MAALQFKRLAITLKELSQTWNWGDRKMFAKRGGDGSARKDKCHQ